MIEDKTETEKRIDEAKALLSRITPRVRDIKRYADLKESIENIESGVEEMQERDLAWYCEEHPDQVLDVMIPEETCQTLWRSKLIDTSESNVFSVRHLCEMIER